jgi:hypothetical protein
MPVADTKRCQTMINICAEQMQIIRAAMATIQGVRDTFTALNPNTTGTPLAGNLATINNAINALSAETDKAIWTQLIAAHVPSHQNRALEG